MTLLGVLVQINGSEQNQRHFWTIILDVPVDLSEVVFIATANNTQQYRHSRNGPAGDRSVCQVIRFDQGTRFAKRLSAS